MGVCPSALGAARSPSSLGLHCPCTGPGVTERAHLVLLFYANPVSTSIFGGWGGRWQGGHAFSSGLCRGVPIPASTGGVPGAAACRGCRQPPGGVLVGGRANSISMWGRGKKKRNDTGNGFIISEQSARAQPQGVFTSHDSKSCWASPGSQRCRETPVAWVTVPSSEPRSTAGPPRPN